MYRNGGIHLEYKIILTDICNMTCSYCYQGADKKSHRINLDDAKIIAESIYLNTKDKKENIKVNFFGGEPLLNFSAMNKIVDELNEYNLDIDYSITTNALLIDDNIIDFLKKNNFVERISIDGDKSTMELNRKCGIKNYFEVIQTSIKKLLDNHIDIAARMTVTSNNVMFLSNNIKYIYSLGIKNICVGIDYGSEFTNDYILIFKKELEKIEDLYLENFYKNREFNLDIVNGKMIKCTCKSEEGLRLCGAGKYHYVIGADTKIYPCSFVKNSEKFCIGDMHDLSKIKILDDEISKNFDLNNSDCNTCEISHACHGMKCGYVNFINTGLFNRPSKIMCLTEKLLYEFNCRILKELIKNDYMRIDLLKYISNNKLEKSEVLENILNDIGETV